MNNKLLLFFFLAYNCCVTNSYSQDNWKDAGIVLYKDTMLYTNNGEVSRPFVEVNLELNLQHKNRYRLFEPYKQIYKDYGSSPTTIMNGQYVDFHILPDTFLVGENVLGRSDLVYYPETNTGCVTDINRDGIQDTLYFCNPIDDDAYSEAVLEGLNMNRVIEFQPSGYPKIVNFSPVYYFASNGNVVMRLDYAQKDNCITIIFPDLNEKGELIKKADGMKANVPDMIKVCYYDGSEKMYKIESKLWDELDMNAIHTIVYVFYDKETSIHVYSDDTKKNPMAGLKDGDEVNVYDLNGRIVMNMVFREISQLKQTLFSLNKGVYIIKTRNTNLKIDVR